LERLGCLQIQRHVAYRPQRPPFDCDDAYDCTVEEMNALSWETRKWWLGMFATHTRADWFRNILGILDFFASDSDFSPIGGWASYSDAGVLVVIQDGWRRFQGLAPAETSTARRKYPYGF